MFERLLDILRCPLCKGRFGMDVFSRRRTKQEVGSKYQKKGNYTKEISEGILYCKCGSMYPVIRCIPRILADAFKENSIFYFKYREKIKAKLNPGKKVEIPEKVKKTQKSFGQQWEMYDYSEKTWSRTADERRKELLVHFDAKSHQFNNKLFLDAGCGNGIEAAVMTDYGCEVVAMDLTNSIERAGENAIKFRQGKAAIHFIQADLMNPPFREKTFDLISSNGVLHHTPNTKKSFMTIARLCKPKGLFWVWLYQRQKWIEKTIDFAKIFTRRMPLKFLQFICYLMAPFYQLLKSTLNFLKLGKYPAMSYKENVVSLSDTITPYYAFNHTPEEASNWYREAGFGSTKVTWRDRCGFGLLGRKK